MNSETQHPTSGDIVSQLTAGKWARGKHLSIRSHNISAIAYRDLLDIYLAFSRVGDWRWVDPEGNTSPRQPLIQAVGHLFRDLTRWPAIYMSQWRTVSRLLHRAMEPAKLPEGNSLLVLRTDHWFNLKSGGSVVHTSGVINGFKSAGYRTLVVSTDRLVNVEADEDFHLCGPVYDLGRNLPNMPELLYNAQLMEFVESRWGAWSPAFIYQRYSLGNYCGALLKQRYRIPFVCEFNGPITWVARYWEKRPVFHEKLVDRIERLNLQAADLIVAVSRPLKDGLVERGIDEGKILVNPNGVDPSRYSPEVSGTFIRRRYGLEGKKVIGFIGTFGPWHGAEVLAEAFGRLLTEFPHHRETVRLLLVGDGPALPRAKQILEQSGILDACVMTGPVPQEEGPACLAACDILASPHVPNPDGSPFFGSPTKLFEYMAMGRGIVASALDQIGEILSHNQTAWLVTPGDAEELMRGLNTLIEDPALGKRLGEAARRAVVSQYTWQEHTRRMVEKLKERTA